jgi:hypothetical protein
MRRLAGILLTVVTIATVVFTFTTSEAGASHRATGHHGAAHGTAAADRHLCESFDHLIRFLRHAPKPSALRSHEGRRVLAALDRDQPKRVAKQIHTMVGTFGRMRDGKKVTKVQDRAASDALFRTTVYAATVCKQAAVQQFATAMVNSRVSRAESATSTTTPAP